MWLANEWSYASEPDRKRSTLTAIVVADYNIWNNHLLVFTMTFWNQITDNIVTEMVQRIYTKNRPKYVDSSKYYTESDYYWLPKKSHFCRFSSICTCPCLSKPVMIVHDAIKSQTLLLINIQVHTLMIGNKTSYHID